MDLTNFIDELYYLLDCNNISLEDDIRRDRAIRLLLEVKCKRATKEITDKIIIDVYRKKGIQGIKKYLNRNVCYLYSTIFCYDVLFYHYKNKWRELEIIIKNKINA
tara:strand:- start:2267 stop:2584 length:318 start_codon:yes stop_codon:yes gene_type:complete